MRLQDFAVSMQHILAGTIDIWEILGYGVSFDGQVVLNHVVFADNIFLLCDSLEDGLDMLQQVWSFHGTKQRKLRQQTLDSITPRTHVPPSTQEHVPALVKSVLGYD